MNRTMTSLICPAQIAVTLLILTLVSPGVAQAQTTYKIQPIVSAGDKVGDPPIKVGSYLSVGTLNDVGQIIFDTLPSGTSSFAEQSEVQYTNGKFALLLVGGRDAPGGKWPTDVGTWDPVSMNQQGNLVFAAQITLGGKTSSGTFLWDFQEQKLTAVVLKGMPAVNTLTFADGGGWAPVINNHNDIALVAQVKNAAGLAQNGVFFLGRDGKLVTVALPDQALPGGAKLVRAWLPSINDAGLVAFLARQEGDRQGPFSGYFWEQGTITPLLRIDADAPGGGKLADVRGVWLNNKNRNVLVHARVQDSNGNPLNGLYLLANGKLTPVAVTGQEMPGGGKFQNIQVGLGDGWPTGVSFANDAGQHAFLAVLDDKTTAAYLMDAAGKLSLILKSGTTTEPGAITRVGGTTPARVEFSNGIGLNNKGQVAFSVHIAGVGGPGRETLVLLTPATP